ncbi:hypothetical protein BpHYR1_017197 [Brachionus plicatilis]|uniref:Uncharacterized protein n=1 Tax=Brachionus plicatilis TaxID=10195 RepID=A0A3M7PUE8_BRAPC|nr:hypothetical protein BpHYR1_017197 [Brachionus plicatilis]
MFLFTFLFLMTKQVLPRFKILNTEEEFYENFFKHNLSGTLKLHKIFLNQLKLLKKRDRVKCEFCEPDLHVLQSQDFFKGIYPLIQDQETREYILEENQRIYSLEYILWFSPV